MRTSTLACGSCPIVSGPETHQPTVYAFGPFTFDTASGEVTRDETSVRLQNQPAALLEALLERDGGVLGRDEIRELLWPDTRVEYDQGINFCVRKIREALGDAADAPLYLETVPRRGYRIIVPVSVERAPAAVRIATGPEATAPTRPTRRTSALAAGLAAAALVTALSFASRGDARRPIPDGQAGPPPLVALLPHGLPEESTEAAAVRDRLAEALVAELTTQGAGRVRLAGPAATTGLLASTRPTASARADLGACYTVSGSVRPRSGGRVRVFTQLIRTVDEAHLWAATDTVAASETSLEGSIATAVLAAIAADEATETEACPGV